MAKKYTVYWWNGEVFETNEGFQGSEAKKVKIADLNFPEFDTNYREANITKRHIYVVVLEKKIEGFESNPHGKYLETFFIASQEPLSKDEILNMKFVQDIQGRGYTIQRMIHYFYESISLDKT